MKIKMKMNLFGKFLLMSDGEILDEDRIHSRKLTSLLAYLIIHRGAPVTSRQLSEQFWNGRSRNPESALKNLMYRLRAVMKRLGPAEYIQTLPGGYQWNPRIPVETDYERYEELYHRLCAERSAEVREELSGELLAIYQRDVSVVLSDEPWLTPLLLQYRSIYAEAVKTLGGIRVEAGDWGGLELLCREGLTREPLDEDMHSLLILSLEKQKKYDQALLQYEDTKKLFYENFGIRVPEKIRKAFEDIVIETGERAASIDTLTQEAGEQEAPHGPLFCDYQIFRQIYRLETRRIVRNGISEHVLLLTVRRIGRLWDGNMADPVLKEGVAILEEILRGVLRIGDVVAHNGPAQFVVLLSACSYEAGLAVNYRIQKNFDRKIGSRRLELRFELEELSVPWQSTEEEMRWIGE